ncbi:carboxylesterase/lipase family protein [Streptomyces fuscichromogenes]|uniref:carboxylesterase/lipase family protein n=1 Tax=Streptomyces fuscichromogenes TaxID=1324013 RepID=UPI0038044664
MTTAENPVVSTEAGAVRGRHEDGLTVFRGIPFAEPPIGEHRFQAPQPLRAWEGVREAYEFGPPPPQDMAFAGRGGQLDAPTGDDWLTVNVWTPGTEALARRPVMVWIYGGAYKAGHGGSPGYDAQHLARAGDVVVVTFNYRLGIEGFARIEGAPANRGLLDQVAALEWVRGNIAAFGGDPAQVTVFGESAGAGSVASLLAMPSARGLFHRAVVQSLPGTFFSDELARDVAAEIAKEVNLPATVEALATVDPRELTSAGEALGGKMGEYADRWGRLAPTSTPFSPVVDGDVLPTTPWQALAEGAGRDVELLVGHNRDEYRLFIVMGGQFGKITEEQAAWALQTFGPGAGGEQTYRTAFPDAAPGELYERVQTDWLFNMPSLWLAEAQVAGGGRAHVYELTWAAPGAGGSLGACHGLDIPLVFGTYEADLGNLLFMGSGVPDQARELTARFHSAWTAFARTGEPGWPTYDLDERLVQVLDVKPEVQPYPEEVSRRIWEGYEFTPMPLLK